jgi:hypothetical protein
VVTESVLDSVKILLGIDPLETGFDQELIMHINSVIVLLAQLGIGTADNFTISDNVAVWEDFVPAIELANVKSYMLLRLRLLFDPPQNSFLLTSIEKQAQEFEWRINAQVDPAS